MDEYYAQQNGKVYYAFTSRNAMENDSERRNTAKCPNIS